MDIQAAEARDGEQRGREDLPIGRDDDEAGLKRAKLLKERFVAGARGLEDRQVRRQRGGFNGGGLELKITSAWLVWLGNGGEQTEGRFAGKRTEAGTRKLRRAHEDDVQRWHGQGRGDTAKPSARPVRRRCRG